MEKEINDIINYNGNNLRVVETPFCKGCFFQDKYPCFGKPHYEIVGHCEYLYRTDRKSVSFINIDNEYGKES